MIPVVSTEPSLADRAGTFFTRLGVTRNHYHVAPGIYCIGDPDENAPVVVSANYKLSFDALRYQLGCHNVWLLVLDTHGINVWCAAGKGTFSSAELIRRIRSSDLENLVTHRQLIVPQLGATGVAAFAVKKESGFEVLYGPVRARDLPRFLDSNGEVSPDMRVVTFDLAERAVLIPVEFYLLARLLIWLVPISFVISGFGPDIWSLSRSYARGLVFVTAVISGLAGGLVLVPLLLPWLPGKPFSVKGLVAGIGCGAVFLMFIRIPLSGFEQGALLTTTVVISSYLGMNFTGSTPYTSPSGVEWEMKRAIPLQLLASATAIVLWIWAPFLV